MCCVRDCDPQSARAAVVIPWRRVLVVATQCRRHCVRVFVATAACLCCTGIGATTTSAQQPDSMPAPVITPMWTAEQAQQHEALLELRLDRPLTAADGRLALLVGTTDLSSQVETRGTIARVSLRGEPNAGGTTSVAVYLVRPNGAWTELGQFPLRRRTRSGFDSLSWQPRIDAQSDGQLGAALPPTATVTRATPFQDVSWNGGFRTRVQRGGWTADLQSLLVAVPRTSARLRASQLGDRAPVVDLASYTLQIVRGPVALSAGHISLGRDRLLVNEFRSRGVAATIGMGRVARLDLASAAGSELVGWDDPLGVARASHRVQSATLALEGVPSQPGLVHAELSALSGSLQPITGFTQGAVTDREVSRGFGGSVVAALPSQRVRLSLGIAQSRFENPTDRLLTGDSPIVPVQSSTRWARYGDLALDVLRQRPLLATSVSLQLVGRHQHTDPLYRSLGAQLQADQRQDALDLTGALGVLQVQGSIGTGRDNLANVATLLVTRSRTSTLTASLPLAQLTRSSTAAQWLPTWSVSWQGNGQRGDAVPDSAGFRSDAQRPDQWSTNATMQLGWQRAKWNIATRLNRSLVDNRQQGRESSDFRTQVSAITLGLTPAAALSIAFDLAGERQERLEEQTNARSQRLAVQADWRPLRLTTLGGAWSIVRSDDAAATTRGRNDEVRVEVSQGIAFMRRSAEGAPARAFVRYARAGSATRVGGLLAPSVRQWTISAGLNARFL
jgi:hypothetical protein